MRALKCVCVCADSDTAIELVFEVRMIRSDPTILVLSVLFRGLFDEGSWICNFLVGSIGRSIPFLIAQL